MVTGDIVSMVHSMTSTAGTDKGIRKSKQQAQVYPKAKGLV